MNDVYLPKIQAFGIVYERQKDGSYTAQHRRKESRVVDGFKDKSDTWHHVSNMVPWDMRLDQDWLRVHQDKWTPAP